MTSGARAVVFFIGAGVALRVTAGWYYKRRHPSTARLYAFIVTYCVAAAVVYFILASVNS
jgi:hypothetical protein